MRALVTGHTGFVGRHISRALSERGWWVDGVDIDDSVTLYPGFTYQDDFLDWSTNNVYDLVVHCAYKVGGRAAIDGVNMNLAENVALDSHLFRWAVRTKQKAVLYFSSSAAYPVCYQQQDGCYGKHWEGAYHPSSILSEDVIDLDNLEQPDTDYGWSKLSGERMARAASQNGLRVHILRPFSGCSGSQPLDYPWPSIAKRAKDADFSVWGANGQQRDWVDVFDVVGAALAVYDADERRPVNICSGVGTEMGDLMKMFAKKFHGYEPEVKYLADRPMGVHYRVGDPQRMNEHYALKKDLEQMVDETVQEMR